MQIVLVKPEHPGNVGAVARVMANFGFSKLILVSPQCDHLSEEAKRRSKHGKKVLEKAKVVESLEDVNVDWLVGTSGKLGSDYNVPRLPLYPWQLASRRTKKMGIVFGPESSGLTNKELGMCDMFVTIPASKKYPVLNLSHSVGIILYELSIGREEEYASMSKKEKEALFRQLDKALETLPFATKDKRETQRKVWRRVIGKATPTKREAFALLGFFRKLLQKDDKKNK